jgi:hypothetical protein
VLCHRAKFGPAMAPPQRLPAVSGSEVSTASGPESSSRDIYTLRRPDYQFGKVWESLRRPGEINDTAQIAFLLIPLFTGMFAFVWDLAARRYVDRGAIPPQPPCPGCGAGDLVLVGGHIDLITVAFVAIPALFRKDVRKAFLRNTTGITLLVLAVSLSIVGLLRGVLIGFTESYRWVL